MEHFIDCEESVNGQTFLKLFKRTAGDAAQQQALLFVEGEKVYFCNSSTDTELKLMYDFSLTPGQGCYVQSIEYPGKSVYLYCEEIIQDERYPGWEVMKMEEYSQDSDVSFGQNLWLKGLCSTAGLTMNVHASIDGVGSQLREVRKGEQVLYSNKTLGMKALYAELTIAVKGRLLTVNSPSESVDISICRQDGVTVFASKSATGVQTIELPDKGFYIVKVGQKTFKVII